jgi:uncharacterized sporulation protein YeaH/YhbH (DUF444 family)
MTFFIDRRLNPKDKSLGNRQRFLQRARTEIKKVVNRSIKDRKVADIASGETIAIPTKGIGEPRFHHSRTSGRRERVLTGNREFATGDRIPKPTGGEGGGGKKASDGGQGEDEFQFALSRDEFLDLFFEDLALPDLVKTSLKEITSHKWRRAGYTTAGNPTNIHVRQTMRQSLGRRLALKRPRLAELDALREEIEEIEELETRAELDTKARDHLALLQERFDAMERKRRRVAFVDPVDVRYGNLQPQPEPNANAVMFCLMDVSGSMGEREKDLAKRFFMLLHLFLQRRYKRIEVVFIRHTHEAREVDEETFFYSRESGGTVVSTALTEMRKIIAERFPSQQWNIYAAQASDGDNFSGDSEKCVDLLGAELMPLCQYYAYVEILDERETELFANPENGPALWTGYRSVGAEWSNFAMKRIAAPEDIYPVFRELFARTDSRK